MEENEVKRQFVVLWYELPSNSLRNCNCNSTAFGLLSFLISNWVSDGGDGSLADFQLGVVAEDDSDNIFFEVRRRTEGPVKAAGLNPDSKSLWVPNGVHWTV